MRRWLAASLLVLIAALTTADRWICLDGCTDDSLPGFSSPSSLSHSSGPCLLCQQGIASTTSFRLAQSTIQISTVDTPEPRSIFSLPNVIEHPPRAF